MVRPISASKDSLGLTSYGIKKPSGLKKSHLPESLHCLIEENRPQGKIHVKEDSLNGQWLFNESGRFAATIVKNRKTKKLRIVLYDCLEKQAFDYFNQVCSLKPTWFYWYGDQLVLAAVPEFIGDVKFLCFELDHNTRNVRPAQYKRQYVFQSLSLSLDDTVKPSAKSIVLDNIEFMPIFACDGHSIVLIPRDPFSNKPFREYYFQYPGEIEAGHEDYKFQTLPITDGKYIYLLKKMQERHRGSARYQLNSLIQVDLSKLEDVYKKEYEFEFEFGVMLDIINRQDVSAYSEIEFQLTQDDEFRVTQYDHASWFDTNASPQIITSGNGSNIIIQIELEFEDRYECLFDLNTRSLEVNRHYISDIDEVQNCIHPLGSIVRIDYGDDQKLCCREVMSIQKTMPSLKNLARKNILLGSYIDELYKNPLFVKRFF